MNVTWRIQARDARRVLSVVEAHKHSKMVKDRRARYRLRRKKPVTRATFWRASIVGLVTSQQPSGPGTNVRSFLRRKPFPLTYRTCRKKKDLRSYAEHQIRTAGLRFSNRLADMITRNFAQLSADLWDGTSNRLEKLRKARWQGEASLKQVERDTAEFIARSYIGLGQKQSRNILQYLGLTKYEIPLDSRVMKWLNELPFPVILSAGGLGDRHYYTFVLDAVQLLCEKSEVEPYILDAAIFTSYDQPASREK